MSEFIVYGIPGSPFLRAALATLEEKSALYRAEPMAPGEHRSEAYRAMNPFCRVPVVKHGDFVLYETQAIVRYIDDSVPGPALQPAHPKAAARMNQILGINDWYVFPKVIATVVFQRIVGPTIMGATADEDICAAAMPEAQVCIDVLEGLLGESAYLAGDSFTLADLMLYPQLAYLSQTPEGRSLLTGRQLAAWLERMSVRPACSPPCRRNRSGRGLASAASRSGACPSSCRPSRGASRRGRGGPRCPSGGPWRP